MRTRSSSRAREGLQATRGQRRFGLGGACEESCSPRSTSSPASPTELDEFPSAGDTSYAGVAPIDTTGKFLVTYYSSDIEEDPPWARAMFGPTDIWQATIDLH